MCIVENVQKNLSNYRLEIRPTGLTETTLGGTPYPHSNYPNLKFSDLSGIGTTKFPAKYLKHVGLDFFISANLFTENDVTLPQKMKKKLYFVHSKIDNNMQAERRETFPCPTSTWRSSSRIDKVACHVF